MKFLIAVLLAVWLPLLADEVKISADRFEADEAKMVSKFIGHVMLKRGSDELNASQVIVTFNKKHKPKRYEATGNVEFSLVADQKRYLGNAQKLIYLPATKVYELIGDVLLREPAMKRTIKAQRVIVEKLSGRAQVEGKAGEPVKFTFEIDESNGTEGL